MNENSYIEQAQLSDLLTRYFAAIDDKRIELPIVEATFTKDARIERPNGSALVGHDAILNGHLTSFSRFKATHHVITDYVINIQDDSATIRTNLTAMHVWADANASLAGKHFLAGAVLTAKALKAGNQWRISELANRNVWRTGDGMQEMATYERPDKQ